MRNSQKSLSRNETIEMIDFLILNESNLLEKAKLTLISQIAREFKGDDFSFVITLILIGKLEIKC